MVPGSKRPWSIAPDEESHPVVDGRESLESRSREEGRATGRAGCGLTSEANRVASSMLDMLGMAGIVGTFGRAVWHFGQTSPVSCGTMTAAHAGQERMSGTRLGE